MISNNGYNVIIIATLLILHSKTFLFSLNWFYNLIIVMIFKKINYTYK